ncbi:MAG: hypothetical protein B7C24_04995 [Bacteroidetes bacterium 4572_77]|nr:MAG: hypothetical protein B7C24_04995 [Bacteroidetes bacterium 4572_77]
MYRFLFLLCIIWFVSTVSAGSFTDSLAQKQHVKRPGAVKPLTLDSLASKANEYCQDYSHKLSLFLYGKYKYNKFSIYHKEHKANLLYTPNGNFNTGFGFNYKWLGIGLAFNLGAINNDDEKYGETSRLDLQTNIYLKKMVVDFYFQYYKGFYINNPQDVFIPEDLQDHIYKRPDISTVSLGLSAMYVFNHEKFSYRSAFKQTSIQKKSAGSFLLGGTAFLQGVQADSSIFPSQSYFEVLPKVKQHSAIYFGVESAYAHNFVIKKHFFVSLSLMLSMQFGFTNTTIEDLSVNTNVVPVLHLQPRFAIGVNKPKWYAGFSFVQDNFAQFFDDKKQDWNYSFSSGHFRVFIGKRVNWF